MSSNKAIQRINFASIKNPLDFPDFLEVQLQSFQDFIQLDTPPESRKKEGLYKVFTENFPITAKIFILARNYKGCDRKSLSCALNGQIRDSCAQHGVYTEVQSAILSLTMQNFLLSCLFPPLSLPVFTLFHSAQGKPII